MKTQITKQIALNYLNQHSESYMENLLLMEQTDTRWVFWSEEPINNRGEFYEVEIDTTTESIRWKIVKGFENLNAVLQEPLKSLHTLRQRDTFRFGKNDKQVWVCWLKLNGAEDGCYFVRPIESDGSLGHGKSVHNALVYLMGKWSE